MPLIEILISGKRVNCLSCLIWELFDWFFRAYYTESDREYWITPVMTYLTRWLVTDKDCTGSIVTDKFVNHLSGLIILFIIKGLVGRLYIKKSSFGTHNAAFHHSMRVMPNIHVSVPSRTRIASFHSESQLSKLINQAIVLDKYVCLN